MMTFTFRTTMPALVLLAIASVTVAPPANAASKTENLGVLSGAIAGAAAGGPVGMLAGAAIGGHYAHQRQRAKDAETAATTLHSDLAQAQQRAATAAANSAQMAQRIDELARQLAAGQDEIEALLDEQAVLARLHFDVLFRTDDARLSDADTARLQTLSEILNANRSLSVRLDGFADSRGSHAHNDVLSMQRAQAVAGALLSEKVDPQQIDSRAFGKRQSQAPADDVDALARERRVRVGLVRPALTTGDGTEVAKNQP